jgi:hypothetical protein
MTNAELYDVVTKGLPGANIFLTDVDYAKPTTRWLTTTFYTYFLDWLKVNGLEKWKNKFDCDNFEAVYYAFAHACHSKSDRSEEGIAVGQMFYKLDGGRGGHAINVAVTDDGLIFIEPQNGRRIQLSTAERESCWFVRF